MRNLAIIPARGGSKRIPKKNIKEFFGTPIIAYPIRVLINSGLFEEIMVSTDDHEIAEVSKELGAKVPFLRSKVRSNDYATISDVIEEVISEYLKVDMMFDSICCVLPTAALITEDHIQNSFNKLQNFAYSSVVPVVRFSYPIQRALREANGLLKMREPDHINSRSQDLENFYHDSGQFYWLDVHTFNSEPKIFSENTGYLELKDFEVQDVDTFEDWKMLEIKFKYQKKI